MAKLKRAQEMKCPLQRVLHKYSFVVGLAWNSFLKKEHVLDNSQVAMMFSSLKKWYQVRNLS
jgi:hypothetical protein